jgi:hypothetical protein
MTFPFLACSFRQVFFRQAFFRQVFVTSLRKFVGLEPLLLWIRRPAHPPVFTYTRMMQGASA